MIQKYAVIFGLLCILNTAWADVPSRASLEQLLVLQNFDNMLDDSIQQIEKQNLIDAKSLPARAQALSQEKQAALVQIMNRYVLESIRAINTPETRAEIRRLAIDAAQKVYTQQEVNALIQFYSTPEGRSIVSKQAQYFDAIYQPMMQVVMQKSQMLQQQKKRALSRELNQVLCSQNHFNQKAHFMEKKFLDILVCPVTKGKLEYKPELQELWSRQAKLAYPIKDGIPYMLETEARELTEQELHA